MENIMNTIKMLRQKYEYTQEEFARMINVSKATVIAYEKDSSNIPASTVANIAKLFDVDCDCIIHNTEPKSYTYEEMRGEIESQDSSYPIRIEIPEQDVEKFKEVFLYIIGKIGALPHVGQTVLYKILYFIDFDYYELHEKPLIGAKYIKNTYGPTPVDFAKITKKMVEDKELIIVKDAFNRSIPIMCVRFFEVGIVYMFPVENERLFRHQSFLFLYDLSELPYEVFSIRCP